jgi:hypothetical protein
MTGNQQRSSRAAAGLAAAVPAGLTPADLAAGAAVTVGTALLGAAAFVLSYPGLHGLSQRAGLGRSVAWILPVSLDVATVSAILAVIVLRRGRSWRTVLAWLCLLVVLAAAAAASAATTGVLNIRASELASAVAIAPWPLLLIAVGLLLAVRTGPRQRIRR